MDFAAAKMMVKFWGVRGSVPTPVLQNLGSGGNTSCLEIRISGGEILIVDGGTGVRSLGVALEEETRGKPSDFHLFLTHFHWDHIQGLPFFQPLYSAQNSVTFYSGKAADETREILEGQMKGPYFPVDFRSLPSERRFIDVTGQVLCFGNTEVRNFSLNHPQGCRGYSFTTDGRKLVFASDLEHGDPSFDDILLEAAQDADVLIYDAQFTPQEYVLRRGWGHSTWLDATTVAKQANARKLILFHHDPSHSDDMMQQILLDARAHFSETYLAIEGESFAV